MTTQADYQTTEGARNNSVEEVNSADQSVNEESQNILELTHQEACDFFLKQESYCNFDLPKYFTFEPLLKSIDKSLKGKKLSDFFNKPNGSKSDNPKNYDDINYKILHNKDGKYAWRAFHLINPVLYVSLVHNITSSENWSHIRDRFKLFAKNNNIECASIPRQSLTKDSDKAEQTINWSSNLEQRSLELALDYSYLTHTDLSNCYESIYTHSIEWALHGKAEAKKNLTKKNLTKI